jgi:N-acetylneuraminic acid mutarotase
MKKIISITARMRIEILSLAIIAFFSTMAFAQKIVWKPLASLPQASYGGEAVAYNNKIYFVSYSESSNPNFYEYEILNNKWNILPDLPDRGDAAAAEVDGKIYVISGELPANTNTNFVYNPETNEWNSLALMPTLRKHFGCGRVNHKIYIMGGITSYDDVPSSCTQKNEVYDVAADSWAEKAPVPTLRNNPAVVAVDSLIYIIGGAGTSSSIWQLIKTVECYNTNTDKWETKKEMPVATLVPGAVAVNKKVIVLGGQNESGAGLSSVYVYDPATNTWSKTTSLPKINVLAGLVAVDNKIYVIGGTESVAYDAPLYSDVYEGTVISEGNFIPEVYIPIPDIDTYTGDNFSFYIPPFSFIDDDTLSYTATLENGDELPEWLNFDKINKRFFGYPVDGDTLSIVVFATDNYQITVSDTFNIIVWIESGIKELMPHERIEIFPNPTTGKFSLSFGLNPVQHAVLKIFDLQGKLILNESFQNTSYETIDFTSFVEGIYRVKIIADGVYYEDMVIKE